MWKSCNQDGFRVHQSTRSLCLFLPYRAQVIRSGPFLLLFSGEADYGESAVQRELDEKKARVALRASLLFTKQGFV
jgi:hypothetical protein